MNTIEYQHKSVMPNEVLNFLSDLSGKTIVDATAGGGGHLFLLANAVGPKGRVLAFDKDPRAHQEDAALGVAHRFKDRVTLYQQSFSQIKNTLIKEGIDKVDGLICDLGVSSNQLDDPNRGFSLQKDGPIDMRMNTNSPLTAYEWLRQSSEKEIADAIFQFGEERKSRAIARLIKKSWPIEDSTLALAKLVLSAIKQRSWSKTHPATRTFQAIRMAINEEVNELVTLLNTIPQILSIDGTAVFISFHSIEDRIVKNIFKDIARDDRFSILTKKPIIASDQELIDNRRSRSAKLRALRRNS